MTFQSHPRVFISIDIFGFELGQIRETCWGPMEFASPQTMAQAAPLQATRWSRPPKRKHQMMKRQTAWRRCWDRWIQRVGSQKSSTPMSVSASDCTPLKPDDELSMPLSQMVSLLGGSTPQACAPEAHDKAERAVGAALRLRQRVIEAARFQELY